MQFIDNEAKVAPMLNLDLNLDQEEYYNFSTDIFDFPIEEPIVEPLPVLEPEVEVVESFLSAPGRTIADANDSLDLTRGRVGKKSIAKMKSTMSNTIDLDNDKLQGLLGWNSLSGGASSVTVTNIKQVHKTPIDRYFICTESETITVSQPTIAAMLGASVESYFIASGESVLEAEVALRLGFQDLMSAYKSKTSKKKIRVKVLTKLESENLRIVRLKAGKYEAVIGESEDWEPIILCSYFREDAIASFKTILAIDRKCKGGSFYFFRS